MLMALNSHSYILVMVLSSFVKWVDFLSHQVPGASGVRGRRGGEASSVLQSQAYLWI